MDRLPAAVRLASYGVERRVPASLLLITPAVELAHSDELRRLIVDGVEGRLTWLRTRGAARPG